MKDKLVLILTLLLIFSLACSKDQIKKEEKPKEPKEITDNNFILIISDIDISNPENDRRCYYNVYIDKIDSGRTTIALESQKKIFETRLEPDRHLVKIEKWVLDEDQGKYVKLNNILQPKPDFIYVDIKEGVVYKIIIESTSKGTTLYNVLME
ncbi:MAG TPA: hypothetical protein PKX79_01650 [Spirochaetota bacterium]|nr:hypothetical protein [Spirochaetota bacterium]HOK91415.1 hypothetical protein [Spirochaetota bacterium]HON16511.1 hypothetical protein [Spirochaetota bacterium]HPD77456.1 hypothetical protein [Spirochaetota bacterium]HPP94068.1 hypothetical protein [Spirochaetota bacterium]